MVPAGPIGPGGASSPPGARDAKRGHRPHGPGSAIGSNIGSATVASNIDDSVREEMLRTADSLRIRPDMPEDVGDVRTEARSVAGLTDR